MHGKKNNEISDNLGVAVATGVSRQEILKKHYAVHGRMLDTNQLRQQILPMLETAGLITQERNPDNKTKMLVYPIVLSTKSSDEQRNSENNGGVNTREENNSEVSRGVTPDLGVF